MKYFWAVSSSVLGAAVLLYSLLQPDRPIIGIIFGVLFLLNGVIRLYLASAE
jgi:lipid-A-disaccharide synthase-like uncharacterized protein